MEDRGGTEGGDARGEEPPGHPDVPAYDRDELELQLLLTYVGRPAETEPLVPGESPLGEPDGDPEGSASSLLRLRNAAWGPAGDTAGAARLHPELLYHLFWQGCDAGPPEGRGDDGGVAAGGQDQVVVGGRSSPPGGTAGTLGGSHGPFGDRWWIPAVGPAAPAMLNLVEHQPGLTTALVEHITKYALSCEPPSLLSKTVCMHVNRSNSTKHCIHIVQARQMVQQNCRLTPSIW